ncbi:MAG: cell division topological specificity factor MinE [Lachnospiraceae bacterium]|nr:cell division topological specificity factor MinE [Lachnospiraceae bacterium]MCI7596781.1 cell division topological specificity factor MinE [Lachnospiraceae bacterium]MDD7050700.1 cell division topological specificity factor MinE [Lachnospiraceae bacterium]MDY3221965.1 cell division topological specificity factor MinE [Lachnospiraceae bacterium]MDY4096137.1 cell division topological specificity factor MinE [Lachnospiraceae bacterium]
MKTFKLFSKKTSSQVAKDRLKILLISDRINCSPEVMERIKVDLVKSISKYMSIDVEHMEIVLKRNHKRGRSRKPSLYASIPILDIRE